MLTSLRLENMVWDVLAEMAEAEGRTTNALISLFHDEILAHRGEVPNFASLLRVTCMRYLRRQVQVAAKAADHGADHDADHDADPPHAAGADPATGATLVTPTTPTTPVPPRLVVVATGLGR